MLDHHTQSLLSAALKLPSAQQFQLIDALLEQEDSLPADLHASAPPLTDERRAELVQEGKDAVSEGRSKSFSTPKAMADHVHSLFDQARNSKLKSKE